jgi:CRP/FNR family transcriptional regulator
MEQRAGVRWGDAVAVCERAGNRPPGGRETSRPSLEGRGGKARHGPHSLIFMEGDPADRVYQIVDGAVMLYKLLPDGRRQVVELLRAGDLFGVSSLRINDCAAETLTAATLISVERAVVDGSPDLQRMLTQSLARKLLGLHEHAVTLGRKSALERVTTFLMEFIPDRGGYDCAGRNPKGADEAVVHLAMTRQEIADYLGLTLETVSRAFSELRRRGAIVLDRQDEVRITDVCGLCHMTGAH